MSNTSREYRDWTCDGCGETDSIEITSTSGVVPRGWGQMLHASRVMALEGILHKRVDLCPECYEAVKSIADGTFTDRVEGVMHSAFQEGVEACELGVSDNPYKKFVESEKEEVNDVS